MANAEKTENAVWPPEWWCVAIAKRDILKKPMHAWMLMNAPTPPRPAITMPLAPIRQAVSPAAAKMVSMEMALSVPILTIVWG